jgi:hypothetical protein
MTNNKKTILLVIAILLAIITVVVYSKYFKKDYTPKPSTQKQFTEDDFTLNTEYIGDNTWQYNVVGTLPNACYEYTIDPIVRESYPEQVEIVLNIQRSGDICAQVIQNINQTETFSASQEAQITFTVSQD